VEDPKAWEEVTVSEVVRDHGRTLREHSERLRDLESLHTRQAQDVAAMREMMKQVCINVEYMKRAPVRILGAAAALATIVAAITGSVVGLLAL
jgi:hypothetical protein